MSARKHYANVPRAVILRAMAADQCLDSRLRHAMILWSWCGPEVDEANPDRVVRKDARGFIERDRKTGEPIPATPRDLRELLEIPYENRALLTRAAQALEKKKLMRKEGEVMYLEPDPPKFSEAEDVDSTINAWNIAGLTVQSTELPSDPVARTEAIRIIEARSTAWKKALSDLKTVNRNALVRDLEAAGIFIGNRRTATSREDDAGGRASSSKEGEVSTAQPPARSPVPPSPISEPLREYLLKRFDQEIPDELDDEIFAKILAEIPDEAALNQFMRATERAQPKKWALLADIAAQGARKRKARGATAEEARPTPQSAEEREREEFIAHRAGETLGEYKQISGNPDADIEQWFEAQERAAKEYASSPRVAAATE